MTATLPIHSQNSSVNETIDFSTLEDSSGGVQPVNFAGSFVAFRGTMRGPNGEKFIVTFGFSEGESYMAGEDASNLPWDADHVMRIERE